MSQGRALRIFVLFAVIVCLITSLGVFTSLPADTAWLPSSTSRLAPLQPLLSRFSRASDLPVQSAETASYSPQNPMSLTLRGGQLSCDSPQTSALASSLFGYFREPPPSSFSSELNSAFLSRLPFSPPLSSSEQFLSFEPDAGGWNNVRMSLESVVVLALVTGRTLVLPPPQLFYLLDDASRVGNGEGRKAKELRKTFGSFFPLFDVEKLDGDGIIKPEGGIPGVLKVISMADYLEHYSDDFVVPLPSFKSKDNAALGYDGSSVSAASRSCFDHKGLGVKCEVLHEYLRASASATAPWGSSKDCFVVRAGRREEGRSPTVDEEVRNFCGKRHEVTYDDDLRHARFLHLPSHDQDYRLLSHFYSFVYFEDPFVDRFIKRFVRDFLHYKDDIFCKAATIVDALKKEARSRGKANGAFSTFHIRRGDFQYKEVKISAKEMLKNVGEVLEPNELIYISTDERNMTFFKPFLDAGHTIRFLSDYDDIAGLSSMDNNYFGMLDTAVAAHGRVFVGTWFSTFTGYINRLRGYLGKDDRTSWFSFLPRKDKFQFWEEPLHAYFAREWPTGWRGIDEKGSNSFTGTRCSGYKREKAVDRKDPFVDLGRCDSYG